MEITRDAIIAAFQRTEIHPVARTWDTRAVVGGHEVACGCALVALCRAAGIDPDVAMAGRDKLGRLAAVLGLDENDATALMLGWDRWPASPGILAGTGTPSSRAAYLAAWEAAAAILGPAAEGSR